MRRLMTAAVLATVVTAWGAPQAPRDRRAAKDQDLKKQVADVAPDKALAGDVSRKVEKRDLAPGLTYDSFRVGLELQVAGKRREQIEDLKKIIELSQDKKERPHLLFRLGELYWEESKYFFLEGNRKEDEKILAQNRDDKAGVERAEAEKTALLEKSKSYAQLAVTQYSTIVQRFKDFERTDEVLYFLGLNLIEMGDDMRGLVAYKRLVEKFKKSKYVPDAWLAIGEHYFNSSKGKRELLDKALEAYKTAASFPDSSVYGYALYKQGWCYFNMADFAKAMDQFKAVVLYAELAGTKEVEGGDKKGKGSRAGLVREARADYVRAFARSGGSSSEAKERFTRLTKTPDELRTMMKQLANLYYEDGRDKDAALTYNALIQERPISPEAPGFQSKIIDCVMRTGNKKSTVGQVARLVKIIDEVQAKNANLTDKDKKAIAEARELSERSISNLAVNWHNEGKKTRDEETFALSNEVYAFYLTLFPDSPKSYDLRFFWATLLAQHMKDQHERAANEYTRVLQIDIGRLEKGGQGPDGKPVKPGKYMAEAAYNAVFEWDTVVKELVTAGKIKDEPVKDAGKKLPIAPQRQALLEACDRYLKYVPKGEKVVEINYKAAKVYYDHNWLDEAVKRFADIALNHPDHKFEGGDRAGEIAANLILDSFNLRQDWPSVNDWARKFLANEKLATGKFRTDLERVLEESAFKLIEQYEAQKDYAKAGEAYLAFVGEFTKSDYADEALFNASVAFFKAKMLNRAIEVRRDIIQKFPKSKNVPDVMFALAESYEAIASFEEAAEYYEAYAAAFERSTGGKGGKGGQRRPAKAAKAEAAPQDEQVWREALAQDALLNAGIFRDGLGQYKKALADREKYLTLWPTAKEAETVTKSIIDLYEKMGAWTKVVQSLNAYEKKVEKDPSKRLATLGRVATVYEEKLRNPFMARRTYELIRGVYDKLSRRQREGLDSLALDAVGRADFVDTEKDFAKYSSLKLRWPSVQKVAELKASIKAKAAGLADLEKRYTKTVSFKAADPAVCALYKLGLAYDQFSGQLESPPVPKGIPEELLGEVKAQFADQAKPVRDKAAEAFAAVVNKSQELDVFNKCTSSALEQLRTKYRPAQFPVMKDDVLELKVDTSRAKAVGQDLLVAVQPVTGGTVERPQPQPQRRPEAAAAPEGDVPPVGRGAEPPPKVEGRKEPSTVQPKAGRTGRKGTDDEPEEPL